MKTNNQIQIINDDKNTTSSSSVLYFRNNENTVHITVHNGSYAIMSTNKGVYTLIKHPTLGIYQGECNGIKVHLTHKAWVGKLIFWA